jgi:uncharacterized phage protein gp47/JayE
MAPSFRQQNSIFKSLQSYLNSISNLITDFSIGSVLNSIFYSISNGIADLYATSQNIYEGSFIATATNDDLDDKVADFNLRRRLATRASGTVTFYRNNQTTSDVVIPLGTILKTITTNLIQGIEFKTIEEITLPVTITDEQIIFLNGKYDYNLFSRKVYDITSVTATVSGISDTLLTKNIDYYLDNSDSAQAKIVFTGTALPTDGTIFKTTYSPLSVDIEIQASATGAQGNVSSGTITNSQNKPAGIDEVYNFVSTSGGTDAESDSELRNRVPLYLSSLSKGTKDALKAAALSVDGVKNANVIESNPPNGIVTIFIDDGSGGSTTQLIRAVKDLINGTTNGIENPLLAGIRAAGIAVNITSPTVKQITINVSITLQIGYDSGTVTNEVITNVNTLLNSLSTGESVIRVEIIRVIKEVIGVQNIDLDTLSINGLLFGDVAVNGNEVARLLTINVRTKI